MPTNTVKVDRSTVWGNPFMATAPTPEVLKSGAKTAAEAFELWLAGRALLGHFPEKRTTILNCIGELTGKDLACWCKPGQPCHADVLLRIANLRETA